jgi:hypothetical protein
MNNPNIRPTAPTAHDLFVMVVGLANARRHPAYLRERVWLEVSALLAAAGPIASTVQ